ncbi:MAG: hypothetical protein WC933_03765 [Candidatus Paceibacterota bacterium]|jgi:hypothetical protein
MTSQIKNLYQITNLNTFEKGSPFALCEKCFKEWEIKVQGRILYNKIGENTNLPCNECEE